MSEMDEKFMQAAIEQALKGRDTAAPNPIVGAVIVEDEKIVSTGYHRVPGEAHAEVDALKNLKRRPAKKASLYVTLEPCSTVGRTGKCTDVIIDSGIQRVCIGTLDPNPLHDGRGVEILRQANITVEINILEEQCRNLNPEFNKRIRKQD